MTETNFRWQSFLDHQAVKAGLASKEIEAFKYQFDLQREHQSAQAIAKSFGKENPFDTSYDTTIKRVYNKLTNLVIDLATTADKAGVVWQWLRQEYRQWVEQFLGPSGLGVDDLWSKLRNLAKYAPDRMGMYVAGGDVPIMGVFPRNYRPSPFLTEVPKGTQGLKFKIVTSEKMRKVLLLQYDDEAKVVCCFCPSEFASSTNLHRGEKILPQQPESRYAYLGATTTGKEEWWGWIICEMPPLSWLKAAEDTTLPLNTEQLAELLIQVKSHEGEVLRTFYRVI
jgi:hypothetical protein